MAVLWMVEDAAERVLRERRSFRDVLRRLPSPPCDVEAAELIYGELVANALRYANGAVQVRLELLGRRPLLIVRDYGPGLPPERRPAPRDPLAESGRGLAIVEMLADEFAVERKPEGGTEVRAVLPVTEHAPSGRSAGPARRSAAALRASPVH